MTKQEALRRYFGYSSFRPGQEEIIDRLLAGEDALCVMPTGAGKSVCYQIPALLLPGITLVISPLISLMKDQVGALVQNGVPAAYLNSLLTASQQERVLQGIAVGKYRIVYLAPERLAQDSFRKFCATLPLSLITVDEAHCVSQWGQDFRPGYLLIREFIRCLPKRPPVAAFTATATTRVRKDIEHLLELRDPFRITTGFDRPNLFFSVRAPEDKDDELLRLLSVRKEQSGIVYCTTRKSVEQLCDFLNENGFSATRYHAGLSVEERQCNQDDFLFDRKNIMVATNAFGMGIDKSNVSYVIHYSIPKDPESYYQEAGRAGRDGSPAECILLYAPKDVRTNRFLIQSAEPNEEIDPEEWVILQKRELARLQSIKEYATSGNCLRGYLLRYFGERAPAHCGACGNCRRDLEMVNITLPAQMLLSCIARTGQTLPASVIVEILHGDRTPSVLRDGLEKQTTFGLLREQSPERIREILSHLLSEGYLSEQSENLLLGTRSSQILKQRRPLSMLCHAPLPGAFPSKDANPTQDPDPELLRRLKETRMRLASRHRIPPYMVFSDQTLREMCLVRPHTDEEMLSVNGVGHVKLERFGEAFLLAIDAYERQGRESNFRVSEPHRAWTSDEDEQLMEEFYREDTLPQMAREHTRPSSEIRKRLRELKLIP